MPIPDNSADPIHTLSRLTPESPEAKNQYPS